MRKLLIGLDRRNYCTTSANNSYHPNSENNTQRWPVLVLTSVISVFGLANREIINGGIARQYSAKIT